METENNPIDKLFASKLRHLEIAPGLDTWNRLHQLQRAEKKKKGLWFAVAASVSVLLLTGLMVWQYTSKTEVVTQEIAQKTVQPPSQTTVIQPLTSESTLATIKPLERIDRQIQEKSKKNNSSVALAKKKAKSTGALPALTKEVQEKKLLSTEALANVEKDLPEQPKTLTGTTHKSIQTETEQTTVVVLNIEQIAQVSAPIKSSLEAVSQEADSADPDKRKTRVGRIFQQIKKLKNGEKVDWKEVGIRPDNLLALVKPDRESKSHVK